MRKHLLISLFLLMGTLLATAQEKKNFTLEDLYQRPTFSAKSVRGMNSMKDGATYGNFEKGALNIYNYKTGKLESMVPHLKASSKYFPFFYTQLLFFVII